eukprot:TRINITY_DN27243_c0_g1_i2.p1 TRINITY_DN27243_c0_g1~~TRINITY_DN27243_c0_g1_i2.p1  ORF type:complete len:578 (+),score=151.67 TRINITY_DN27243_c0_g1_i2:117-1850(+)
MCIRDRYQRRVRGPVRCTMEALVLTESMDITVDYGLYHTIANAILVFGLLAARSQVSWRPAHYFALFAWAADYFFMYLAANTRAVQYSRPEDRLSHWEVFLFFWWFDYFGALLLLMFVRQVQHLLEGQQLSTSGWVVLLHQPVLFWTAPVLAPVLLGQDARTMHLSRPSPKLQYLIMLMIMLGVMRTVLKFEWRSQILPVLGSGLACGLCHHGALFFYGLRHYSSLSVFTVTILTEWPALISALSVCCAIRVPRKVTTGLLAVGAAVVVGCAGRFDEDAVICWLMPNVPGTMMQSLGTGYLRARTCVLPSQPALSSCWPGAQRPPMLVLASAPKGGAVLAAKLAEEVGLSCGLCVASGERSRAGIPGPVEALPTFKGEMLLAIINMRTWPEYVQQHAGSRGAHKCVAFSRDPLNRLVSLYLYARSGGEHWFRHEWLVDAGLPMMTKLSQGTLNASLQLYWNTFGRAYLVQSGEYMHLNGAVHNCTMVKMEAFKEDFDHTARAVLGAWEVTDPAVVRQLLPRMRKHDLGRKSRKELAVDPHVTGNKFDSELVKAVPAVLMSMPEVAAMVREQREQLHY